MLAPVEIVVSTTPIDTALLKNIKDKIKHGFYVDCGDRTTSYKTSKERIMDAYIVQPENLCAKVTDIFIKDNKTICTITPMGSPRDKVLMDGLERNNEKISFTILSLKSNTISYPLKIISINRKEQL